MRKLLLSALLFPLSIFAQGYTSYFTGSPTDVTTTTEFGVCMMGGATEHDNAMKWLLQKANGGDIVVLRSSGSNGYNDYLYSELGITVNSVETLVITSVAGATNPYVLDKVAKAEMIWFAGGDQWNYVSYFKNNALEDLLNNHINVKQAPIGGTSAGMAILGGKYFSAQNGSVTSAEALANPYNQYMTLGNDDFLQVPFMADVVTDTHYDSPDRKGRHCAFLAKLATDLAMVPKGIACNEYVAVCIGNDGLAHVYGDYPAYEEFAYFIQPQCGNVNIETCQPNAPLTWLSGGQALQVYKVPGTMNGTHYFNVNVWEAELGSGGWWEDWTVNNGVLNTVSGVFSDCLLGNPDLEANTIKVFPNPFQDELAFSGLETGSITIYDAMGKVIYASGFTNHVDTSAFANGLYVVKIQNGPQTTIKKLLKN